MSDQWAYYASLSDGDSNQAMIFRAVMKSAEELARLYPNEKTRATDPNFQLRRAVLQARFANVVE